MIADEKVTSNLCIKDGMIKTVFSSVFSRQIVIQLIHKVHRLLLPLKY